LPLPPVTTTRIASIASIDATDVAAERLHFRRAWRRSGDPT
jgi:hypothetical protein